MNELIKVTEKDGKQLVSARELHEFLEVSRDFTTWFKYQADRAMLEEGKEFTTFMGKTSKGSLGGRPSMNYALTLSAAKEIAMLNGGEKGKQARKYFIACEERLKEITTSFQVPQTFAQALLLAAKQQEEIEQKQKQLEAQKPKVEFYDQVTGSRETTFAMGEVAKVCNLGIGRNTLFSFLRNIRVLMPNNIPYQKHIDAGHFRVIESKYTKPNGDTAINLKTVVFQKGVDYIIKKWNDSLINKQ